VSRSSRKDLFGPSTLLTNGKRQYAAAKISRTGGDWIPCNQMLSFERLET